VGLGFILRILCTNKTGVRSRRTAARSRDAFVQGTPPLEPARAPSSQGACQAARAAAPRRPRADSLVGSGRRFPGHVRTSLFGVERKDRPERGSTVPG